MKHLKVLIWVLLVCLVWFGSGCRVSRSLKVDQSSIDSARKSTRDSMLQVQKSKDSLHVKELNQVKAAGVVFRDKPVPVYITDDVGRDSLIRTVASQASIIASFQNEIEILADGSMKAKGAIASAYSNVEMKDKEIKRWRDRYDSLLNVKQSDSTHVKVEDLNIDKTEKRGSGPWPWIALIAGIVIGFAARHNIKRIKSLFKFPTMKSSIILFLLACSLFLTGCTDFHNAPGVSVWSKNMWMAPVGLILAACWSAYRGWRSFKSGSKQQGKNGTSYSNEPVKWYRIYQWWIAIGLVVFAIGIIISVVSNR